MHRVDRKITPLPHTMLAATIAMYALSVTHWAIEIYILRLEVLHAIPEQHPNMVEPVFEDGLNISESIPFYSRNIIEFSIVGYFTVTSN
jgi:hypothetical protein